MFTMKEACEQTQLPYEILKYYIDWKQGFYDDVLSGRTKYYSNLINTKE